jgi:hypothetical protein
MTFEVIYHFGLVNVKQSLSPTLIDVIIPSAGFFPLDMDKTWNRSIVPLITWKVTACGHSDGNQPGIVKLVTWVVQKVSGLVLL